MEYYMFNGLNGKNKTNKPKSQLSKRKILKLVMLLTFTLLVGILIFLYNSNEDYKEILDKHLFRKEVYEDNLPSIQIDSSKSIEMCAYGRYIAVLEQNVLKLYNKSGNCVYSLDIEISNPLFETNGNYLCIAEKNGQKLYLISDKNIIWQNEIEGNIKSISVNKNGYVAITISGTSYKNAITTYDASGNELFTTYLSTTNVIDTDISNDNKYLAIAEANFSGIVVQSNIKIISIEDAQKKSSESIKYTHLAEANDLIINIKYQNKNELACMYDKHIDIFADGQNKELFNFTNEEVLFSDINLSNKALKIIKKSTGLFSAEAEMKIININNQKETTYEIENIPKKVYVQNDIIAIDLGTSALFVNDNGWLVKKYESSHEIQKIILCNNIAGIISKNKIEIISL